MTNWSPNNKTKYSFLYEGFVLRKYSPQITEFFPEYAQHPKGSLFKMTSSQTNLVGAFFI